MTTRPTRDIVDTLGLLFEASRYLELQVAADIEHETGLPAKWFETLIRLRRSPQGTARMAEIAARVSLPPSSFSRLVDQMESASLVSRGPDPSNRRATLVRVDAAGERVLDDALDACVTSGRRHMADLLTDDELDQLERITRRLRDANLPQR
nr:MarR family winged helix-turn-helix transcriptional regulator [Streptomyces sp. NBC_00886]